jgi:hypothetical protein
LTRVAISAGAGLGERQAEDLLGPDAGLQQQPQHPRAEHLGLAGARRGAEPDGVLGETASRWLSTSG